MDKIKIIVGSTSVHKIKAVECACKAVGIDAEVTGFKTSTRQNEQPVGFDEIFAGALERAAQVADKNHDQFIIGIESGIVPVNGGHFTLDIAGVVLITSDARMITTTSSGIRFPETYVEIARKRGFDKNTVGSVIAEIHTGDKTDPHSALTDGKVTRTETLVEAIKIALKQI